MALEKVVKAEILFHRSRRSQVLSVLERSGKVHLTGVDPDRAAGFSPADGETGEEIRELRQTLDRAVQYLSGFAEKPASGEVPVTRDSLENAFHDRSARDAAREALAISGDHQDTVQLLRDTEGSLAAAVRWGFLPFRFDEVGRTGRFAVFAGLLPDSIRALPAIRSEFPLAELTAGPEDMMAAVVHGDSAGSFSERISSMGFIPGDFNGLRDVPSREIGRLEGEVRKLQGKLITLEARARKLAQRLPEIRLLYDAAGLILTRDEAASGGLASTSVLVLHAWVMEKDIPDIRADLERLAAAGIDTVEPNPGEVPPVSLSEHTTVDPYLLLTDMFGRPAGADPDPTPLFAPFYALFFGICIGDAGYGAALVLGSALGWWLVRRRAGNTRLFRLIFQGGLASIPVGILLGGWFGIEFQRLPGFLQSPAMLLNGLVPGYTPGGDGFSVSNQFLYLTLALGLVQLAWGVMVNLPKRLRQGEGLAAVVEQTGWLLSIAGLFPWLFNHYLLGGILYDISGPADRVFLWMLGAGALLIFIMGGRSARGIGGKVGLGAYATYGIVNLLGDVLSYSRLFALALSSAIIAQVVNEIAGMVAGSIAGVGLVLAVLVLAAGHLFNLAMAVLSGFIHTARLQFVEFFGKFYDGTGVPFSPLRYRPRFVRIVDSE